MNILNLLSISFPTEPGVEGFFHLGSEKREHVCVNARSSGERNINWLIFV